MSEVIFERIAPVVTVHDVDAALARYGRLGFTTELCEPAQYGFADGGWCSFTSNQMTRTSLALREASCTSMSLTLTLLEDAIGPPEGAPQPSPGG